LRPTRPPRTDKRAAGSANRWQWFAAASLAVLVALPILAAETPKEDAAPAKAVEKSKDVPGSRSAYIHRLPLMDIQDPPQAVNPSGEMPLPFSFRATCNKCHPYELVSRGWHFNAMDPKTPPGRPGEPWFVCDATSGTQLPISYRKWPDTWRPDDVGIKPWGFIQTFGHHLPGGGPGEAETVDDPNARWGVSGKLEINCQACHSGDPEYDQINYFIQIGMQNFMWAPSDVCGFASVTGQAAKMPGTYMPLVGPEDERMAKQAPAVRYDKSKFNSKGQVYFNIPYRAPAERCYFCHSSREVGKNSPELWKTDVDVHLKAGMACADCHRNGLDHAIRRGYEGEPGNDDPRLATLTCRGCHLGDQSAAAGPNTMGGRLGAPVPQHVGLPTIHLENLACTTCHSGPIPQAESVRVQTSRAHALEFQGDFRGDDALPYIQNPVYVRRADDGKIGPERAVWPAFWARVENHKVSPLPADDVYKTAKVEFDKKAPDQTGSKLSRKKIAAVLAVLAEDTSVKGEPVYVAAGKVWHAGGADIEPLSDPEATKAAEPAMWPIGHDVRPKGRSLGSGGCNDCHTDTSPIFFGKVTAEAPADLGEPVVIPMYEFLGKDPTELKAWAMSYQFRPMFKVVGFATAGLMATVLLAYLLTGMVSLARWAARRAPQRSN
jgi:hypothetical protein